MTEFAKGQRLCARFLLVEVLGQGAWGQLWRAIDEQRSLQIALKVLPLPSADEATVWALMQHEYAATQKLEHPGILRVEAPVRDATALVLPMPLAAGDARALRGKPWTQSIVVLRELTEALVHAHSRGVLHRDLKPGNVLIDFDGRARLADFAVASLDGQSPPQPRFSKFSASPESQRGAAPSVSDDVYGFGALAYELLSGYPPNFPDGAGASAGGVAVRPAAIPNTATPLPEGLSQLVLSALEPDPSRRPQDMGEIARVVATLESSRFEPVTVARIVPLEVAAAEREQASRPQRSWLAWAGVVVLGASLLGVFLVLPRFAGTPSVAEIGPAPTPVTPASATSERDQQQAAYEEALARFTTEFATLDGQGAGVWGGATFAAARSLSELAATAAADGDAVLALDRINVAVQRLERVAADRPAALERELNKGETALDGGQIEVARQAFELARLIEPENGRVGIGLARVAGLAPVLPAFVEAETAALSQDHLLALTRYEEVLRADPRNAGAREGAARARAALGSDRYAREIGEALAKLRAGRDAEAKAALDRARALRPDAAEIGAVSTQLLAAGERQNLEAVRAQIAEFESGERWAQALAAYDALLARDSTIQFARAGRAAVAPRAELARRLDQLLNNPARLSAPEVRRDADRLLSEATKVQGVAPVLESQTTRLRETLRLYDQPVALVLQSDGLTRVILQRVGGMGSFTRKELSLKPGRYVLTGDRPGYRDVRREFTVLPGSTGLVVEVRCTESIS
ncbi:MAG: protein kinase domain-containing protein [Steroidobacteraceae bacterium]